MANGGWHQQQAQFENEVKKEGHRRMMEYITIGLVVVVAFGCAVSIAWPSTTKTEYGKAVTVSGPTESAKSAAQTLLTTIVGAAIGYALKQNPNPIQPAA